MTNTIGRWTEVKDAAAFEKALALCKGDYQRNFISGIENLSGSTLRGKAKMFSSKYQQSRRAILRRLDDNGIAHSERIAEHGARILIIG